MLYNITPGIAALVRVTRSDNMPTVTAIYTGPERLDPHGHVIQVEWSPIAIAGKLPPRVVAAVHKHFGRVFSVPAESRPSLLRPIQVFVDDEEPVKPAPAPAPMPVRENSDGQSEWVFSRPLQTTPDPAYVYIADVPSSFPPPDPSPPPFDSGGGGDFGGGGATGDW